jgi:hypothetical protein
LAPEALNKNGGYAAKNNTDIADGDKKLLSGSAGRRSRLINKNISQKDKKLLLARKSKPFKFCLHVLGFRADS